MNYNLTMPMENNSANKLQEMRLRFIMAKLKRLIPFTILIQNSEILYIKNQKYFPIIFLTRSDYFKMIISALHKIVYYFKTPGSKIFLKDLIRNKFHLRIIITQSGKIFFQKKKF